jgi:hypothetical protein
MLHYGKLSIAGRDIRPAVPGSRPEGDGSDVSTEPDCEPSHPRQLWNRVLPALDASIRKRCFFVVRGPRCVPMPTHLPAASTSCSLDDPVCAWRKTGHFQGTILAVAGAVVHDDTETTIRRPVQRSLEPQTGATLRAQPARGPHLRAIDAHRLMRTALLSQSVIDALCRDDPWRGPRHRLELPDPHGARPSRCRRLGR